MSIMPSETGKPKNNMRSLMILGLVLVFICTAAALILSVTGWNFSSPGRKMKNPVPVTQEAIDDGMFSYMKHCQSCHGADGDGKGERVQRLAVKPPDFTNAAEMNRRRDGELYWRITRGKPPMPAFQDKLTDTERWQLVIYIRSLAPTPNAPKPQ